MSTGRGDGPTFRKVYVVNFFFLFSKNNEIPDLFTVLYGYLALTWRPDSKTDV